MKRLFPLMVTRRSVLSPFIIEGMLATAFLLQSSCSQPASLTKTNLDLMSTQNSINATSPSYRLDPTPLPPLTRTEVLAKFRERATTAELSSFESLAAVNNSDSQIRAIEMVLFKLSGEELSRIGISQESGGGHFNWALANSTGFSDGGKAFEKALGPIKVYGVVDLGLASWFVPREQFFKARRALLDAGLPTNEITIFQPQFSLR